MKETDRSRYVSTLLTLLFAIGLLFSLVVSVFPQTLVRLFVSTIVPETSALAAILLRVMVWSAIPMLLIGIFRSFLQVQKLFFVATISDVFVNLFIIGSIVSGKLTGSIPLMGAGAVVGNTTSMLMLAIFSVRKGLRYRPLLDLSDPYVKAMFRLMLPVMLSSAVLEISQIINRYLASSLAPGTVSALNYAAKINSIVAATVGVAISTALFPRMAELAAEKDFTAIKKQLIGCVKALFPFLLPLTVGIVLMARPITRLLLERGVFISEDTARTAECLRMYALGLIAVNLTPLITRVFYAIRQAKWPAVLSVTSLATGIALNFLLIGPLEHRGLALAASVSSMLSFGLQLVALRKKIGLLGLKRELGEFGKIILASAAMAVFVWLGMHYTPILAGSYGQCLLWTVVIAGGGALFYGVLLVILRAEILRHILERWKNRGVGRGMGAS